MLLLMLYVPVLIRMHTVLRTGWMTHTTATVLLTTWWRLLLLLLLL